MSPSPQEVRNSLEASEPGARGLEHMARNSRCLRLVALTLAGASPAQVSDRVYGRPVVEGLSPFAIRRGERFEEALFTDGCKRIFELYHRSGRIDQPQGTWVDMSQSVPGLSPEELVKRRSKSEELIRRRAQGDLNTPNLIVKARLAVPLLGQDRPTEPDGLWAGPEDPLYRPVEIKSYADRQAYTDTAKTGSACRQASVALIALRALLPQSDWPDLVDLIFARPASNWPTLHQMDVSGERSNLSAVFDSGEKTWQQILDYLEGGSLDDQESLEKIPNHFCSDCAEHCPLWEECRGAAVQAGDLEVLGSGAAEFLAGCKDINQALDMMQSGEDADPGLDMVAKLLHLADSGYRDIMGDLE